VAHAWAVESVIDLQSRGWLLVEDGNHGEYRPRAEEFVRVGTAFIRAADMDGGRILFARAERIDGEAVSRIRKGIGRPGDVLLSHKGTVGKVSFAPLDCEPFVCSPQTTFWRVTDERHLDRRYLYYFLQSRLFKNQLNARKGETDMADYVSLTTQRTLRVLRPDISEQRAIADVLGALDDKIELNRRMNETMEATARAIFQSWFVNFDPARAKAEGRQPAGMSADIAALFPSKMNNGVPIGWRPGTLGEVAQNKRTQVKPGEAPAETPYIGLEHMPRKCIALAEWGRANEVASNKFAFSTADILFGKLRPYFHKVGLAAVNGVCSTDVLVVTPKAPAWFGYVLGHFSSDELIAYTDAASTGTKMPRTSWNDLARYQVVMPTEDVARTFSEVISPMTDKIRNNIHESRTLATLRDTLLPKLLSGEVRAHAIGKRLSSAV